MHSYWRNFKTDEWEYLTEAPVDRAKEFIPQIPAALNLYDIHIELGETPLEAMRLVLEVITNAGRPKSSDGDGDIKRLLGSASLDFAPGITACWHGTRYSKIKEDDHAD